MPSVQRHYEVAQRVIDILKTNANLQDIKRDQIYLTRFPFVSAPSYGIAVSPLVEEEGTGLNELDDVAYPVQLTKILHRLHPSDGLDTTALCG